MEKNFHWILNTTFADVGISAGIIVLFILVSQIFSRLILKLLVKLTSRTKGKIDNAIISAFHKPFSVILILTGFYLGLTTLPIPASWNHFISTVYHTFFIICVGWGLFLFSDATRLFFNHVNTRFNLRFDEIVIPFISKVLKFIIAALTISIVAYEWGYNINGFVAGLGLGGLALALAAKDTLSNLFGGLVIIMETPFTIDDWIKTPSVEGTVEDINFRSTKIRTFEQAVVTVPNSTLANEPITNWSRMGKRRITFKLSLDIRTPKDKLLAVATDIRELLSVHNDIDPETSLVHFYEFAPSSLDLLLYFFTKTTTYVEWLSVREDINTRILAVLESHHVRLGVPSQKIYYEPSDRERKRLENLLKNQLEREESSD